MFPDRRMACLQQLQFHCQLPARMARLPCRQKLAVRRMGVLPGQTVMHFWPAHFQKEMHLCCHQALPARRAKNLQPHCQLVHQTEKHLLPHQLPDQNGLCCQLLGLSAICSFRQLPVQMGIHLLHHRVPGQRARLRRLPDQRARHSGLPRQRAKRQCCYQRPRSRKAMYFAQARLRMVMHLLHHLLRMETPAPLQSVRELLVPDQSWQRD